MTVLRQRQPRQVDAKHLAAVRRLPCMICRQSPCDAAHIRMSDWLHEKSHTGRGQKPDDKWSVPLCHRCHMDQHTRGERVWWEAQRIDPIAVAIELYAVSPDIEAMTAVVNRSR